jgi:hypothetical protein
MAVGAALALASSAFAGFGSIVSSFQTTWAGTGLAWDGSYLWYWGVNHGWRFLRVTTTGSVVSSFGTGGYSVTGGATYDGRYLWCAVEENIPPPRPAQITRYTTGGSFVSWFYHRGPGITNSTPGLAYEPGYLWVENYKYYVGGGLIGSFPFPAQGDLAWDGRYMWCGAGNTIIQTSTSGSIVDYITTPGIASGLTFDGEYVWVEAWLGGSQYWTYQYDIGLTGVEPASVGRIKALYR